MRFCLPNELFWINVTFSSEIWLTCEIKIFFTTSFFSGVAILAVQLLNKIHKIVMKHLIFHFKVYQVVVTRSILRFKWNAKHNCWYYTKLISIVVPLSTFFYFEVQTRDALMSPQQYIFHKTSHWLVNIRQLIGQLETRFWKHLFTVFLLTL